MHVCERRVLQDTVTAIRLTKKINELGFDMESNGQRFLRPRNTLRKLFPKNLWNQPYKLLKSALSHWMS